MGVMTARERARAERGVERPEMLVPYSAHPAFAKARERARAERGVERPEMLVPYSAHPAFAKAAKYLGLELKPIPLDGDYRADVEAAARLVGDETALIVGSAPNYPWHPTTPLGSRIPFRSWPPSPPSAGSPSTPTRAWAGSCSRFWSGWASPFHPSTSASPG
jgi:glutamate/tyrosine decarboxylase-like PLP-dependent enzyme